MIVRRYSDVRDSLKTGDLVFFTGRGLAAWLIQRGNDIAGIRHPVARKFVHVGYVVRDDRNDIVLLSESTMLSRAKDVVTGKRINGLHTVTLSDRIREVGGRVWMRRLDAPLTRDQVEAVAKMRIEYRGRKYERHWVDLFRAAFDWFGPSNSGDTSSLFCSEWTAMLDQATGLLPQHPQADEYIPAQLATMPMPRGPLIEVRHG